MYNTSAPFRCLVYFLVNFFLVFNTSCSKQEVTPEKAIFDSAYKDMYLHGGLIDFAIPIYAKNWSVEYVNDAVSGEAIKDQEGKPLGWTSHGQPESGNGWLKLKRTSNEASLTLTLQEHFSPTPRKFVIGILADGKREELSFTQTRGKEYRLIDQVIVEVAGSRKIYSSDEGIRPIVLTNNSSVEVNMETSVIYKDVKYGSAFYSDDDGAFDWIDPNNNLVFMDAIMEKGKIVWQEQVPYQKGLSEKLFMKPGGSKELLVMKPNTSVKVRGEIIYLERECRYTFTVENLSGIRFAVSGTWKQKVPLSTHTSLYDN